MKTWEVPELDLGRGTGYRARLWEQLLRNDPRMVLLGQAALEDARQRLAGPAAPRELAHARRVRAAISHPLTGGLIPRCFRVSAFPWMNVPLVVGFLAAGTAQALMLMQVANQAYNASFNLVNGAHGGDGTRKRVVARNFLAATSVACLVVLMGHLVEQRLSMRSPLTRWIIPYLSVVAADLVNVGFARSEELVHGAPVADKDGRPLGSSRAAGRAAVARAVLTRSLLLPLVALLVPTALVAAGKAALPAWAQAAAWAETCLQMASTFATLMFGLPACTALFPQRLRVPFGRLEPAAQGRVLRAVGRAADVYVHRGV